MNFSNSSYNRKNIESKFSDVIANIIQLYEMFESEQTSTIERLNTEKENALIYKDNEKNELYTQINKLKMQIQQYELEKSVLSTRNNELSKQINDLSNQNYKLKISIQNFDIEVQKLTQEKNVSAEEIEKLKKLIF